MAREQKMRLCVECREFKPLVLFGRNKFGKEGRNMICDECYAENGVKRCTKCGETKPYDEFYHNTRSKDGHLNLCKECCAKAEKAYRQKKHDARIRAEKFKKIMQND